MAITKKRFSPAISRHVGQLVTTALTPEQTVCLYTNPAYLYEAQRDHVKGLKSKKHIIGLLFGNAQQFAGAFCEETMRYYNLDGYHRGYGLAGGTAWFAPSSEIQLTVHRVKTKKDLRALYDQFNSATAAKKSTCYFGSGLRDAGIINKAVSSWINGVGKVTMVQYGSGVFGTTQTAQAVVIMAQGIMTCDAMNLPRAQHVTGSVKGACLAIAQYCPDSRLAELFIRGLNDETFDPSIPTIAEQLLMTYRENLQMGVYGGKGGGGAATEAKFLQGLRFFVEFAFASRKRKAPATGSMSLPEFKLAMRMLGVKAV
jgi:hypothetical protein